MFVSKFVGETTKIEILKIAVCMQKLNGTRSVNTASAVLTDLGI